MKKIVIQGRPLTLEPCGIKNFTQFFILNLAKKISNKNILIEIPVMDDRIDFIFPDNVKLIKIPPTTTSPEYISTLFWENIQSIEYLENENPEDILCLLSTFNCLPLKKLPVKEFVVVHDIDLWIKRGNKWPLDRQLGYEIKRRSVYNADLLLTVSDFSKREIKQFFNLPDEQILTIYEDINPYFEKNNILPQILSKYNLIKNQYYLYIGSFEARKNVDYLIGEYNYYQTNNSSPKKLVLKLGKNQRLNNNHLSDLSNNPNIILIDDSDLDSVIELYSNAFSFIYPSLYEGFGLQLIEAQALSCPLLISDIEIFHEIAGDGACYFNPKQPSSLYNGMLKLENDNNYRLSIINQGKVNRKRFSWEKTVDKFLSNLNIG